MIIELGNVTTETKQPNPPLGNDNGGGGFGTLP